MKDGGVESYRTRIRELEREIRSGQKMLDDELKNAGETVFEKRPDAFSHNGAAEAFDDASRLRRSMDDDRKAITRIRSSSERIDDIAQKISQHETDLRELAQQNIPHYEKIGQAAFEYYRENPFVDQEYADVFRDLLQTRDDLQELEKSIRDTQRDIDNKPMIERMVSRGRLALLKSRRTARINAFPKMYRTAGERIGTSEFLSMNQDESIAGVAGPFLENMRRMESVRTSLSRLQSEKKSLEAELAELCDGKKPARRVSDLEAAIRSAQEELAGKYREIGRIYRESLSSESETLPEIADYLKSVSEIEKENSLRKKQIDRLKAAIDIERLTRDSLSMQHSIQQMEDQIQRQQSEIAELNGKIAEVEQEKKKLMKVRGAEETLLEG